MRLTRGVRLVWVGLAATLAGAAPPERVEPARPDRKLPAAWNLKEIAKTTPYSWDPGAVHVLAWLVKEDERPLCVEVCLLVKQLAKPTKDRERWALTLCYRHPTARDAAWRQAVLWLSPDPRGKTPPAIWGYEMYKGRPTNKDVAAFLKKRGSPFELGTDWKLRDGEVRRQTWKKVLEAEALALFRE
jgi:hypothetical protein